MGTFTCTAIPGEFVWLPGILTKVFRVFFDVYVAMGTRLKAVLGGQWIVMEDIDYAPPDVVSGF